jgi:MFS family permease
VQASSEQVTRTYFVLAGLYTLAASIIWGVNTLFLLDAGLSVSEVFVANAGYSIGTVLFEIPTGVLADTLGRRVSFLSSIAILGATTLLYVSLAQAGAGIAPFFITSVLMGLGFTFYSGAMEAWLVDALDATGYEGDLDHVFARGQQITGAAMLVGTVGGGLLGQIDLALPYLTRAAILGLVFVLAFGRMRDIGFHPHRVTLGELPGTARSTAAAGIRFGWGNRSLRGLMIAGALQMGFFSWAWYAWQPYLLELLDRELVWVSGVVSALLALSMIGGNQVVDVLSRRCGFRTTLLVWSAAVFSLAGVVVGVAPSFWIALPALCLMMATVGVTSPTRQAFIHETVASGQRATVVSFDSLVAGVGGTVAQPALGAVASDRGYGPGFVVGSFVTMLALPVLWAVRRESAPADRFGEGRCAVESAQVPHGVPRIATLDPKAGTAASG